MLSVRDLKVYFPIYGGKLFQRRIGEVKALDGVDLDMKKSEVLALVGESGCGKTTLARTILGLLEKTSGAITFEEQKLDVLSRRPKHLLKAIQPVFQDPYSTLNPRRRILDSVVEGIDNYQLAVSSKARQEKVAYLLNLVELHPSMMDRYPAEFSAGQRQRIAIARALAVEPRLLVLDEPVSSLDVSVQDRILKLLLSLQRELGLTYLFITHDLAVIKQIADRVAVMYLGKIVEFASPNLLYRNPTHPYTKALLEAVPIPDPILARSRQRVPLAGEADAFRIPTGCRFHPRCPLAGDVCREADPAFEEKESGHLVACHKA